MNMNTFLKKIKLKRKHWDLTIDTIIKKGLENEMYSKKWSIKDVIAHITWYDKALLKALKKKSIVDSDFWSLSIDDRNEMIFNNTQEKSFNELLKESKETFDALIEEISKLSDEELNSEDYIKREPGKRITWDFIGGNNFWHYEDHEDALIELFNMDYGL
ncbi:MAG: DinB family protein [Asgard group archaeon]|nr:DinB family protein [Asgard group archaeon]